MNKLLLLYFTAIFLVGCSHPVQSLSTPSATPPEKISTSVYPSNNVDKYPIFPKSCYFDALSHDNQWLIIRCDGKGEYLPGLYVTSIQNNPHWITLYSQNGSNDISPNVYFSPDSSNSVLSINKGPLWLFKTGDWVSHKILSQDFNNRGKLYFSPDSQTVAIQSPGPEIVLSLMDMNGNSNPLLQGTKHTEYNWQEPIVWAPDSVNIAYLNENDNKWWIINRYQKN